MVFSIIIANHRGECVLDNTNLHTLGMWHEITLCFLICFPREDGVSTSN